MPQARRNSASTGRRSVCYRRPVAAAQQVFSPLPPLAVPLMLQPRYGYKRRNRRDDLYNCCPNRSGRLFEAQLAGGARRGDQPNGTTARAFGTSTRGSASSARLSHGRAGPADVTLRGLPVSATSPRPLVGAKWGATIGRHQATYSPAERSRLFHDQLYSDSQAAGSGGPCCPACSRWSAPGASAG